MEKSPAKGGAPALGAIPLRLAKGRPFLVGVSGGVDSAVLLDLLRGERFRDLVVCHLDHGLRGRASREDARFVGRLAAASGMRFFTERADVGAMAERLGLSLETAARQARLAFFSRVAERVGTRTIFLAHHAEDQAETVLMNVLRGSGISGLRGMRPVQQLAGLRVIRPLLGVRKSEIEAFAAARGIRFRVDGSNAEEFAFRNRLRLRSVPLLSEAMGRDVTAALTRLARVAADEDDFLEGLLAAPGARLPVAELRGLPVALGRRWVRRWLRGRGVPEPGFDLVESVRALAFPGAAVAKVNLPGGWHARRRAGEIFVEKGPPGKGRGRSG